MNRTVAWLALLPVVALEGAPVSAETAAFTPPSGPVVLSRTVTRVLHDGKAVVVTRRYRVRFIAGPAGFQVLGEPIGVEVQAPEALRPLAEIERSRTDSGGFPMQLDRAGRLAQSASDTNRSAVTEAAATAGSLVRSTRLKPADRAQFENDLARVLSAGGAGSWPADLFNPAEAERTADRTVPLAGLGEGRVQIRVTVERFRPGYLPGAVERNVTTVLDGTERVSRERWEFTPEP